MRRRTVAAATALIMGGAVAVGVDLATATPDTVCHVRTTQAGPLPDPRCTPGATIRGVTAQQVCTPGWAKAHRDVPASERSAVLRRYGFDPDTFRGEVDHLDSLELGGTNDMTNLWPEEGKIPNAKDRIEGRLHRLVCAGKLDLAEAQREISTDWTAVR